MKGRILGADGKSGAITGEDGKRYKFESSQWRAERVPIGGEDVDFEVGSDGAALDVYPIRGVGPTLNIGDVGQQAKALLGDRIGPDTAQHLIALATRNPLFQISLAILAVSCLFTFVKVGTSLGFPSAQSVPFGGSYSVLAMSDLADSIKGSLEAAATGIEALVKSQSAYADGIAASNPALANVPNPMTEVVAKAKDVPDTLRSYAMYANILYLIYLAPLGAIALIVQLYRARDPGTLPMLTGIACVGAFGFLLYMRHALSEAVQSSAIGTGNPNFAEAAGKIAYDALSFGFGAYLLLLCGMGLLALSFGLIRVPARR